jgi:hypothetical protein
MTEHSLKIIFDENAEKIGELITEEINRLRSLGYSRAEICERSFEIEDNAKAKALFALPNR